MLTHPRCSQGCHTALTQLCWCLRVLRGVCKAASDRGNLHPPSFPEPCLNANAPEQILQLPLPSLSCSANHHPISILVRHPGQTQVHPVHPSVVRAVGNKKCDTRLMRTPCRGQAVHHPLSTLHPHTANQVGPRPSPGQGAVYKPHSCCPCGTAASAIETSKGMSPALLDLEQVQQKALNIIFAGGSRLCIPVAFHWLGKKNINLFPNLLSE